MISLNYKKYGEQGPVIIILHGLFGMLDNWHSFAKLLAQAGYTVYGIDQRDHGKSPHTTEFSYDLLAKDLSLFITENKIEKAHLIGHSMGGKTVMKFCLEYPQYVLSQTIVDMAPKKYQAGHNEIFGALLNLDLEKISSRKNAEETLMLALSVPTTVQFLLKNLQRKTNKYSWKMNLKLLYESYPSIIDATEANGAVSYIPSLFVRAGNSNYILEEDEFLIDNIFPNYTMETIEDSGHWIHAEKPKVLLDLILDFID